MNPPVTTYMRNMTKFVGVEATFFEMFFTLRRIAEGGLELGALPMGMTRELTCGEIRLLETVEFAHMFRLIR